MIIKVIYRKGGAENFRTMTIETENDLLVGCMQECNSYNCMKDVLKQYKGEYSEVKNDLPDITLDVSADTERVVRQMHKAFGRKHKYTA